MQFIERAHILKYKLRCIHCDRDQELTSPKPLNLGYVIQPAPGGQGYGVCLFCKRAGLKVIDRTLPPST